MTTAKKAKFACPDCDATFDYAKVLGSHRRLAHGIAGTSSAARTAQKRKAMRPKLTELHQCPDCDFKAVNKAGLTFHRMKNHGAASSYTANPVQCPDCDFKAKDQAGLTIHRKTIHKAVSQSATAVAIRASDPLQCTECGFRATSKIGLANHLARIHKILSQSGRAKLKREERAQLRAAKKGTTIEPAQTITAVAITTNNGHHQEAHTPANGIPEGTLALALGRFQELCRSIATEHDLPPRSFAAQLARLIYATTLR